MDRQRRVERLARRYFSAAEQAALEALEPGGHLPHFYRLWSLKEAWTKARGGALPTALGSVGFHIEDGSLASLAPEKTENSSIWLLELPGYSLAACALRPGLKLRVRCWLEGPPEPSRLASLGAP